MRTIMPAAAKRPCTTPIVNDHELAEGLQGQYEGRVLALVVQDLAEIDPKAGESTVMELIAKVWELAERHTATSLAHLSWLAHHIVTTRSAAYQTAGC